MSHCSYYEYACLFHCAVKFYILAINKFCGFLTEISIILSYLMIINCPLFKYFISMSYLWCVGLSRTLMFVSHGKSCVLVNFLSHSFFCNFMHML